MGVGVEGLPMVRVCTTFVECEVWVWGVGFGGRGAGVGV